MILLYLTLVMIVIHFIGAVISFKEKTFPKQIGNFISIYEMIFYILVAILYSNLTLPLLILLYLYLLIHVVGGVLYLKGYLGKLYSSKRVKYYGVYEVVELLYLLLLTITML